MLNIRPMRSQTTQIQFGHKEPTTKSRPKVYLAGPDVFLKDALGAGKQKKELCEKRGLEGNFPKDKELNLTGLTPEEAGMVIYEKNIELLNKSDYVVANLTPYRGPSADPGTIFEVGYALGKGIPVFAYTNTSENFFDRTRNHVGKLSQRQDGTFEDPNGMQLEKFELTDNLMIDGGVLASGGNIFKQDTPSEQRYTCLNAFQKALDALADSLKTQSNT